MTGQPGFLNFINIQQQIIINSLKIDELQTINSTLIKTKSSDNVEIAEIEVLKSEVKIRDQNQGLFEFTDAQRVVINQLIVDKLSINSMLIKTQTIQRIELSNVQIMESTLMSPIFNLTKSQVTGFSMDKSTLYQMKTSLIILQSGYNGFEQMYIPDERISKRDKEENVTSLREKQYLDGESVQFNYNQLSFINTLAFSYINITDSSYNFEFMLMRFIIFEQDGVISLVRSQLLNMRSLDNGGCILFNKAFSGSLFYLQHTILHNCRSVNYGGAIFGGRPETIQNATISSCKSNIGGGLFLLKNSDEAKDIIYKDNEALAYPNYFYCKQSSQYSNCDLYVLDSIYELNRDLQNTTYYLRENEVIHLIFTDFYATYPYIESTFQRGFIYLIKLNIMENNQPVVIPENQTFSNMYQFVSSKEQSYYLPLEIQGINFPYLMTQYHEALDCEDNPQKRLYLIQILIEDGVGIYSTGCYNVTNECLQGQQLYLSTTFSETLPLCSYCQEGQFSYDNSTRCETCQNTLFDRCYVNNTQVKQSFWREKYSNDFGKVYECNLSQKNCQGENRFGVANDLCTEGYVGVMCLSCDVHAEFWGTPYGSNGAYNCVSCSSLTNNTPVIYILLVFFIFLLMLTLQTNFQRMKNQIYRKYLSDLGIIYIGSSFVSQSLGSIYLKLLIFNFQIYSATRIFTQSQQPSSLSTFENLIPSFLNPTNVFGYSFDCIIINYSNDNSQQEIQGDGISENSYYIGEIKLVITVLIPIIMSSFVFVLLIVIALLKRFRRRYILPVLFHAYFYLTVFQIQPQLIQYSIESLQFIQLHTSEGECYNLFDPSISCSNTQVLTKMRILSILSLIFYTILTPTITAIIVILLKKKSHTAMFRFTLGFLTDEYKTKYYYWEFIRIFLIISLSILISLLKSQPMIMGLIYLSILTIYLYQIHLWHPYSQNKMNLIEQKSLVVSMVYFLVSLCYNINNENEDTQLLSQFGSTLTQIMYYSAKTCQFLFIIWIAMLIFVSYFQLALRKLQRYSIINRLSNIFPYILTKIYSKRLIQNLKNFRKKVRALKFTEYQCILRDVEIEPSEESQLLHSSFNQSNQNDKLN